MAGIVADPPTKFHGSQFHGHNITWTFRPKNEGFPAFPALYRRNSGSHNLLIELKGHSTVSRRTLRKQALFMGGNDTILAHSARKDSTSFPPGLHNAFLFAIFNALSYQLVLSSPMVLYATTLGASATVLGVIAGMMPLLVIFQIPAANYIPRVGFKRFVYAGWGTRVMFIFGMALVPLTGSFLEAQSRLALLLFLLFGFNLSRGISSCAWLPWLTALIPEDMRGKYLVLESASNNLSSFCTFMVAAGCLAFEPGALQFSALFGFSSMMGALSLRFLRQIPDAEMPEHMEGSSTLVPWTQMVSYRPFARLLCTLVSWSIAYGGMSAFTVAFLKAEAGMSEGNILLVTSVAFLGGLSSLWLIGSRLDRVGSKPVLSVSFTAWALVTAGWALLAGGLLDVRLGPLLLLQFAMGLLYAIVQMSNTRLAMEVIPTMGRNHFFAIYSVANNVALGLAPIAWGLLIDAIGPRSTTGLGLTWNRFTWFFAGASAAFL
jgi:MFS family permease